MIVIFVFSAMSSDESNEKSKGAISKVVQKVQEVKNINKNITVEAKEQPQINTIEESINTTKKTEDIQKINETRNSEMVKQLNDMLPLVVTDIPYTLEMVANNYSQADRGQKATTASKEQPKKIASLTIKDDVGMKFITTSVENTQKSVSNNFKNAKEQMTKIDTEYGKIKWSSEASDAFRTKFRNLKRNITQSFDDIEKQFTKLMNKTKDEIQEAEKANTVS